MDELINYPKISEINSMPKNINHAMQTLMKYVGHMLQTLNLNI
jgi:serine/threonine-protein kinase RIO1